MKQQLVNAVKNNELGFLKEYCQDGHDIDKLIEIMTLGRDSTDDKQPNFQGVSAVFIAAKNGHLDLLQFLINSAMSNPKSKSLLAAQLIAKNQEGRNVLHVAAITPKNDRIIIALVQAAQLLDAAGFTNLHNYVNSIEDMRGNTALHTAARQCNLSNYLALKEVGADPDTRTNDGKTRAIDLVKYADSSIAAPFMKVLILQTPEGANYFKSRHGALKVAVGNDNLFDELIQIDLNTKLVDNTKAQLAAYKACMHLFTTTEKIEEQNLILSHWVY